MENLPKTKIMTNTQTSVIISTMLAHNPSLYEASVEDTSRFFIHTARVLGLKPIPFLTAMSFFTDLKEFSTDPRFKDMSPKEHNERLDEINNKYFIKDIHGFMSDTLETKISFENVKDILFSVKNIGYHEATDEEYDSEGVFTMFYKDKAFDVTFNIYKSEPRSIGLIFKTNETGDSPETVKTMTVDDYLNFIQDMTETSLSENTLCAIVMLIKDIVDDKIPMENIPESDEPTKPIETEEEYQLAKKEIEELFILPQGTTERERLDVLLKLVEDYETFHYDNFASK